MVLTKTWSAVLAFLAASFLAGMFLLSLGASQAFSRADETGIRAMAQAGVAAIQAEVRASPVRSAASFMRDPRLLKLLGEFDDAKLSSLQSAKLDDAFRRLVNETLLEQQPNMSVALVADAKLILSRTGVSDRAFDEISKWPEYIAALTKDEEVSLSATVAAHLHSIQITRASGPGNRRLVAIQPIDVSGASSLRQILGTSYRAGFVRDGKVVGKPIGGATEPELLAASEGALNRKLVPATGTSEVFDVGDGADRRLAVVARIAGLRAADNTSTHFVVLTQHTAGFSQKDLAQRLSEAIAAGYLGQLNWVLLASLVVLGVTLSLYLPHSEGAIPLRRLRAEFDALGRGQQRQIFHDSYTGAYAELARSASAAIQALRLQWEDEFEVALDGEVETPGYPRESSGGHRQVGQRVDSRPQRVARRSPTGRRSITKRIQTGAIDVPKATGAMPVEDQLKQPKRDVTAATASSPVSAAEAERNERRDGPAFGLPHVHDPETLMGPKVEAAPTLSDDVDSITDSLLTSEPRRRPGSQRDATAATIPPGTVAHQHQGPPAATIPPGTVLPQQAAPAATIPPGTVIPQGGPPAATIAPGQLDPAASRAWGADTSALNAATQGAAAGQQPIGGAGPMPAGPPADEREAYFRDVYERFVQLKIACGETVESVTYEKFTAKLKRNIEDLKKRPDVEDVEFSVYVKDGKAALKAKVVRA